MIHTWKPLETKIITHSKYRQSIEILYELPDGRQEVFSLSYVGKVVSVFALTEDHKVILARQFRPGPNLVLDELPGGAVDGEESLEAAAKRELLEETGYESQEWIPLGRMIESAYSTIERHGFVAKSCNKISAQKLDPNEFIEVVQKPIHEFLDQLRSGQCTDLEVGWAALHATGFLRFVGAD